MIAFSEHLSAAGISRIPETSIEVEGCDPVLATRYPIGEAAATALAIGGATAAELLALRTGRFAGVTVDVGHAAATLIGFILQSAMGNEGGWDLVRQQPSTTGFFCCGDGRFIHLHGGVGGASARPRPAWAACGQNRAGRGIAARSAARVERAPRRCAGPGPDACARRPGRGSHSGTVRRRRAARGLPGLVEHSTLRDGDGARQALGVRGSRVRGWERAHAGVGTGGRRGGRRLPARLPGTQGAGAGSARSASAGHRFGFDLLPAAATDYTTGYLAAYGAMEALRRRVTEGGSWRVEVSLCRTAMWLLDLGPRHDPGAAKGLAPLSSLQITSETPCGTLTHLGPAVRLSNVPVRWQQPTVPLGHHEAVWLPRD